MKIGRNNPCWCGSGLKYKKCHLDREREKPLKLWEIQEKLMESFSSKICLHPVAGKECGKKIIKAHTVQKNGGLNYIAKDGHVLGFKLNMKTFGQDELSPVPIGVNSASTFSGFCNVHDNEVFAPIEKSEIVFLREQIFLFTYRALCRELYFKVGHRKVLDHVRLADKGRPVPDQMFVQWHLDGVIEGADAGLRDLQGYKKRLDAQLSSKTYDQVDYCVIEFKAPPTIMCAGGFNTEYDFQGNTLQLLGDVDTAVDLITCSLIGYEDKGAAILAWPAECMFARKLVESFLKIDPARMPDALVRLVFECSENVFFSESWWCDLPKPAKDSIRSRILSGAGMAVPRGSNCLTDDGIQYVGWEVVGVRHSL